ncbi:MAG: response regulator [Woeseiaceae bacterium]
MSKVLIIDDEKDVRIVLKEVLQRAGYEAAVAADAREGLEKLEADGADLVITDVIMPGMDGVATVEKIRESYPGMPIIVISGGGNVAPMEYEPGAISTNAYLASATKAGADRTLTKPFERQELVKAVRDLLGD